MSTGNPLEPNTALLCKLGSIVRHVQELHSPRGHAYDQTALAVLLDDAQVVAWLEGMDRLSLLPVLR